MSGGGNPGGPIIRGGIIGRIAPKGGRSRPGPGIVGGGPGGGPPENRKIRVGGKNK